jgi:hypothetical protein
MILFGISVKSYAEGKMRRQSAEFGLDESGLALLLGELDHRIRNLLTMIEAAVKQTHSTSVEDYRAKLMARITGLYGFCEFTSYYSRRLGLAQLLEQTMRPHCANSAQVLSKETKAWLAEQPAGRFEFTFTPKHGSWLNLVEGFFSKLTRSVLRHIRVASKQELKDRIMAAMEEFNRHPVVHTWSYKLD